MAEIVEIEEMKDEVTALSLIQYIYSKGGDLRTDSRKVAQVFEKEHKHVLRAIRNLHCDPRFRRENYFVCHEISEAQNGKPLIYFEMTRKGFLFLAVGFTGSFAGRVKQEYFEMTDKFLANSSDTSICENKKLNWLFG